MHNNHSLTLWGRRDSFNVQKVLWFLAELNLNFEHIPAGGKYGGLTSSDFMSMNPHGRIPVLKDDTTAIWESHTILRYLAAAYGQSQFWHADPATRAQQECWMDWQQTTLQPDFLNDIFWAYYRTPESNRDMPAIKASIEKCSQHFLLLNKILEHQTFLVGDDLSLADITVGTTLFRYFELDIERPSIPHVESWYQQLQNRPAYQAHVMQPFAHMYGKLTY